MISFDWSKQYLVLQCCNIVQFVYQTNNQLCICEHGNVNHQIIEIQYINFFSKPASHAPCTPVFLPYPYLVKTLIFHVRKIDFQINLDPLCTNSSVFFFFFLIDFYDYELSMQHRYLYKTRVFPGIFAN